MNTRYKTGPTRFKPKPRSAAGPLRLDLARRNQQAEFQRLQKQLLLQRQAQLAARAADNRLLSAAREAAALAWVTPYPLLVFPLLFDEKADLALASAQRQEEIRQRSRQLLEA